MKTLRIGLVGIASAVAGFAVQGCFAPQPAPECTVLTGDLVAGVTNYWATMKQTSATGTCPNLTGMEVGLSRFAPPGTNDFSIAIRPLRLVEQQAGYQELATNTEQSATSYIFEANQDPSNDCTNQEGCDTCVVGTDGGYALSDGTVVTVVDETTGTIPDPDSTDGGVIEIDLTNECGAVTEPVGRTDPADPNGKNITGRAKLTQFPTNGVCTATDFTGNVQNFQAESVDQVDGSKADFPALAVKYNWSNFKIYMNSKTPGTVWSATLAYTEGGCSANYDLVAFWPIVHCAGEDADGKTVPDDSLCNPYANPDAGTVVGSGINPGFKPKCDPVSFVCTPTVSVTPLQ